MIIPLNFVFAIILKVKKSNGNYNFDMYHDQFDKI